MRALKPQTMYLLLHYLRASCLLAMLLCGCHAGASTTNYFYARTESHTTSGLCIGCSILTPSNAVDTGVKTTFSTMKLTVSVLGAYVTQRLTFTTTATANQDVYILLESTTGSLLSVTGLGGLDITSYKAGVSNLDTKASTSFAISLLSGSATKYVIKVHQTKPFDAIELKLKAGIVSALTNLRVYSAWYTTVTLPVELATFDGYSAGGINTLKWSTASEINNAGFDLERSIDGVDFTAIATIPGAGNSNVRTDYSYHDIDAPALSYYRLLQRDYDGQVDYSPVISVHAASAYMGPVTIVSNPFEDRISVRYIAAEAETGELALYDLNGTVVATTSLAAVAGQNELSLTHLEQLPAGQYILALTTATISRRLPVIKL